MGIKELPTTTMVGEQRAIEVPIIRREWTQWTGPKPLKIDKRSPVIRPVIEHAGKATFAEVRVAQELAEEGATWWCWIDLFNRVYLQTIYDDGPPVVPPRHVLEILSKVWVENGGTLNGAWDAFAIFPDGRLAFREAKRYAKDALNRGQHRFADAACRAYPDVDLAIVEWAMS